MVNKFRQSALLWSLAFSFVLCFVWWFGAFLVADLPQDDGGLESSSNAYGWAVVIPGMVLFAWIIGPLLGAYLSRTRLPTTVSWLAALIGLAALLSIPLWALVVWSWSPFVIGIFFIPTVAIGVAVDAIRWSRNRGAKKGPSL